MQYEWGRRRGKEGKDVAPVVVVIFKKHRQERNFKLDGVAIRERSRRLLTSIVLRSDLISFKQVAILPPDLIISSVPFNHNLSPPPAILDSPNVVEVDSITRAVVKDLR
jgi:hypothetical protein